MVYKKISAKLASVIFRCFGITVSSLSPLMACQGSDYPLLSQSGIQEKQIVVNGIHFNYAEGPQNGPALLLLHAQLLDWYSYHKVLPALSKDFHVYALDYPGHGKTVCPPEYTMDVYHIGNDIATFIETVIKEPVFLSGNSSGGLLVCYLAATKPGIIRAIVLEDPPLFSSEFPEIKNTIAYRAFTSSHKALAEGYNGNFLDYFIINNKQFFDTYTGPFSQKILQAAIGFYRCIHKNQDIEIPFLPPSVQEMVRGLNRYDPRFGNAFYEGSWNYNFDHEKVLQKIQCPTLLLHANFSYTKDGILNGAMSQEMAEKAMYLLPHGTYRRIHCGHVIHLEEPKLFISLLKEFFLQNANS
ncbi:MAG: alpha/beta hydrolase [Treponemataceae bacterium]|nr:alpha/beta hydrolase [Treponemataceae bacterium]